MYKDIEKQVKLLLKEQVDYFKDQVVNRTLVQNDTVGMTIFSFAQGKEISIQVSRGDAMLTVLEGEERFTVGDEGLLFGGWGCFNCAVKYTARCVR